ncbi:retron St85 family effector protein [Rhodovulum sulfidophilum]|nr:retron St85 family effector protein [Rhodovulum sulfidophilum]
MSGTSNDPRDEIVSRISLENCRIRSKPHFIFVCGGKVDTTSTQNLSVRNMFMNRAGGQAELNFILAESYKDWFDGYDDLSEFESDIAGLSSLVAVILESAGSLAELGLFYANEHIRPKLFAVLHREFYNQSSFIKHGILSPLEDLDRRFVLPLDLDPDNIDGIDSGEIREILDELTEYVNKLPESEAFLASNHGHVLLLVFQIIHLFMALTLSEISGFMKTFGIDISEKRLKASLYILQRFELIGMEKRSSQTFFFAKSDAPIRVELKGRKGGKKVDPVASKVSVSQFYRAQSRSIRSEKNRLSVIEKFVISQKVTK